MAARQVLVITFDAIGTRMSGSARRALELARALAAAGHSPVLAAPTVEPADLACPFPVTAFDVARPAGTLGRLTASADLIVVPVHALVRLPFLHSAGPPLVFDLYDPLCFEVLEEHGSKAMPVREHEAHEHLLLLNQVLRRGDFFICASERQRDLWLGALLANGRITPRVQPHAAYRDLIDVVPFGVSGAAPPASRDAGRETLRRAIPEIGADDTVLLWNGGLWEWMDPVTAVAAMAATSPFSEARPAHLVLLAGPNPARGEATGPAGRARTLARESGLLGRRVHFVADYLPYARLVECLAGCDAGISLHHPGLETRYAYRTRILDCVWAGVPVVCSEGDVLADMVRDRELGWVVPPGDVEAVAVAIAQLRANPERVARCRLNAIEVRPTLSWSAAIGPLARFCEELPAPEKKRPSPRDRLLAVGAAAWRVAATAGPREAVRRARQHWRTRRGLRSGDPR